MDETHITESMLYASAFAIGIIASVCRLVHERDHRNILDLFAISVQAGLWSFGIISVLGYYHPNIIANPWFGMGIASLVGLAGKEQDRYLRQIIAMLWDKLGLPKINRDDPP